MDPNSLVPGTQIRVLPLNKKGIPISDPVTLEVVGKGLYGASFKIPGGAIVDLPNHTMEAKMLFGNPPK